jgi:6,7-dimethyl-8-ribityllumazine synthase
MLKPIKTKKLQAGDARFVIIASRYNARYVDAMVRAAKGELRRAGAGRIQVIRVPGAYEIPVVAARLARLGSVASTKDATHGTQSAHASRITHQISALICLGVILRGETTHAAHIGEAVSNALMQIQLQFEVPIIHEVLLLENEHQAKVRCLGKTHNRGAEAAQTALAMAQLMAELPANSNSLSR